MACRYHPGDKVMIRPDLNRNGTYRMTSGASKGVEGYFVIPAMERQAGKVFTIKDIAAMESGYHFEEIGFGWTDDMFVGLANSITCRSLL